MRVSTAVSTTVSIAISTGTIFMGAISMGISMLGAVAFAAAAHADFLYVPAEEPAAVAAGTGTEAATDAPIGPVAIKGGAAQPRAVLWHVHPDETLRRVLGRWGGRAGVEVLFLTDRRYRLHEARTFSGSFTEATEALFAALSHLPHPPVGELKRNGRALAVLHRASLHRASPHRASPYGTRAPGDRQ